MVSYASKHGRLPSEVYEDYLDHPEDYRLMWAYETWVAEEQEKQMKSQPSQDPRAMFRRG